MDEHLDFFEVVSLEEIVSSAALMTRKDRKYLLPKIKLQELLTELPETTKVLEIDGQRVFSYRSLYFDTPDSIGYRLAATKRPNRFKVRTRLYEDSGEQYLEVKTKSPRGETVKRRIPCDEFSSLSNSGVAYVDGIFIQERIRVNAKELVPSLETFYRRSTLLFQDGSRGTLDDSLVWSYTTGEKIELQDYIVVESKTNGQASPLDKELWKLSCRPQSMSKFAVGTAIGNAELSHNKWARLLNRHFAEGKSNV